MRWMLSLVGAVGMMGVAVGAESTGTDGRSVPAPVKESLWKNACALPDSNWDVDCEANQDPSKCTWRRPDGTKFEPIDTTTHVHSVARSFVWNGLSETNAALKLGQYPEDSTDDMTTFLFRVFSGLELSTEANSYPLRLNPAAVSWVERELVPAPSEPMCGHTAQALYDTSFKSTARTFAVTLADLAKGGHLKKVDLARLDREFSERRGGYWRTCSAIGKRHAKLTGEGAVSDTCFFWLRRAATSGTTELAGFTSRFLQRYDPTFYATVEKALTKAR